MAKLTDLPPEIHSKIADEVIPEFHPSDVRSDRDTMDICALMEISGYWKAIGLDSIDRGIKLAEECFQQAETDYRQVESSARSSGILKKCNAILEWRIHITELELVQSNMRTRDVEEQPARETAKLSRTLEAMMSSRRVSRK